MTAMTTMKQDFDSVEDFYRARDIGYDAAAAATDEQCQLDSFDFDEAIFPGAFSDALDTFQDVEAAAISEAVHEGITVYYDAEVNG